MNTVLAVALGGAIGSVARWGVGVVFVGWFGSGFPWATLLVNVTGGFVMGLLAGLGAHVWQPPAELKAFLMTGILGGYTTFSTFSLDAALMIERGEMVTALAYALASVLLSVSGLFAGLWLARLAAA